MAYSEYVLYKEEVTYDGEHWVETGIVAPSGDPIGVYSSFEECELGSKLRYSYYDEDSKPMATGFACNESEELTINEVSSIIPSWYNSLSIFIGDCVTSIQYNAFQLQNMNPVTLEGGVNVETIGGGAFKDRSNMMTWDLHVQMPNLKRIEAQAFMGCRGFGSSGGYWSGLILPESLEYIGDEAFRNVTLMPGDRNTAVRIPSSVSYIGENAFRGVGSLNLEEMVFTGNTPPAVVAEDLGLNGAANIYVPCNIDVINAYRQKFYYYDGDGIWSQIQPSIYESKFYTLECFFGGVPSGSRPKQFIYSWDGHSTTILYNTIVMIRMGSSRIRLGISEAIVGNRCTAISADTFAGYTELSSVTIADTVTSIGSLAFWNCSGLTQFNGGNGLTDIACNAFSGCTSLPVENGIRYAGAIAVEVVDKTLSSYTLRNGTQHIICNLFSNCSNITSVVIPSSVKTIGDYAFNNCSGLTSVTIGDDSQLSIINDYAFWQCSSLTSIRIPGGVSIIGNNAFADCTSLTSVTIANGVTTIGNSAFANCTSLTSVTIPNTVTSIGNAFRGCTNLTSIDIPSGVTSIDDWAFAYCYSLSGVTIPSSITTIGSGAFWNCRSLTGVTIPSGVTSISGETPYSGCFDGCYMLLSNFVNNSSLDEVANYYWGCTIIDAETNGLCIKDNTVFSYRGNPTAVKIPDGVELIGMASFSGSSSIVSVDIPDSVTEIRASAFTDCTSLTSVEIPDSVDHIFRYAFYGCSGLTSVTVYNDYPPIFEGPGHAFDYTNNCPIYVPCEGISFYETYWSDYASRLQVIPNSCRTKWVATYSDSHIESGICDGVSSITRNEIELNDLLSVEINDCVTSIEQGAFYYCTSLTSVTIPNTVTSIGVEAFYRCTDLVEITIYATTPPTLMSDALYGISNNCTIYVPCESVSSYQLASGWSDFSNRIKAIPNSCLSVVKWFATYDGGLTESSGCDSTSAITQDEIDLEDLISVEIGNCVTTIGNSVFANCNGLTTCTIGSGITSIGEYAFSECTGLTSITINATTPPTLGTGSLYNLPNNCTIYVPSGSVSAYQSASGWSIYSSQIQPIS